MGAFGGKGFPKMETASETMLRKPVEQT